jgi:hypothetical protein
VRRRKAVAGVGIVVVLVAVVLLLQDAGGADRFGTISANASSSYVGVGALVFLDAVVPVFPGETTVTPEYVGPFTFTGTLNSVTLDVSGELIADPEAELRAHLARQ